MSKNKRLIRIHLKNGAGIFTNGNTDNLTLEEFEELEELEQRLVSPDIMFDINSNCLFYFTRKGFRRHRKLIKLLINGHSPKEDVRLSKIWSKDAIILYKDASQMAIKQ